LLSNIDKQTNQLKQIANSSKWVYLEKCPLCSSVDFHLIKVHRSNLGLCKCLNCNIVFLNPRPFASGYVANHIHDSYLPRLIANNLVSSNLVPDLGRIYARYRKIADLTFEVWKDETVVDIGCGIGLSMLAMKHLGIQSIGLDVNEEFVQFACDRFNLNVKLHDIFEDELSPRARIATLSSVLEHIPHPIEFLCAIRQNILASQSLLIITVPNLISLEYIRDGENWNNINGGHLFYFAEETLIEVARQAGFEVLKIYRDNRSFRNELENVQIYLRDFLNLDLNLAGGIGIVFQSCD
jgi:SAM-dependent methyltransferase